MTKLYPVFLVVLFLSLSACCKKVNTPKELSHNKIEVPDYGTVFPNDKVQRIDILLDSVEWNKIVSNLKGNSRGIPARPIGSTGDHPPFKDGRMPIPPHKSTKSDISDGHHPPLHSMPKKNQSNPIWVESEIKFNNIIWSHVGIRVKGNSSLHSTYNKGSKKYSFKLDFDQFEDSFPSIKNQRFFGFKQLNLNNNFDDPSMIREKLAADLFRDFGLVAARASFYEVYVDFGTGKSECLGIYTLLEEMDDTPIKTQLATKKGNLYKPENRVATFEKDHFEEDDLNKKNNRSKNDYSDIKTVHNILHRTNRTTAPDQWKSDLEAVFNVDIFLKWLAANATIQNWDSYGRSAHNYYLYNNPADSLLTWIPWDHNEAFQKGKGGGALDLSLDLHNGNWPFIEYILSIPQYRERYNSYLYLFTKEVFSAKQMTKLYTQYAQLLTPYIQTKNESKLIPNDKSQFDLAIDFLKKQVQDRNEAVNSYLNNAPKLVYNNE